MNSCWHCGGKEFSEIKERCAESEHAHDVNCPCYVKEEYKHCLSCGHVYKRVKMTPWNDWNGWT